MTDAFDKLVMFASQHDWYRGHSATHVVCADLYSKRHEDGSVTQHEDSVAFDSMKALRDWAGY